MLITFKTPVHANVTMFGEVALSLISKMGLSETVPSALMPADIPRALERLRDGLAKAEEEERESSQESSVDENESEDKEEPVSLKNRAIPLIDLLEAALSENQAVLWEKS